MPELYGIKLRISPCVYEPDEDTFLLISALEKFCLKGKDCLEIGTGSGIIALVLAKKAMRVTATDIDSGAVACARGNAARNRIKNAEFRESDLFSNIAGKFDLIVFNPPYLPDEPGHMKGLKDVCWSGGKDGRQIIRRFIAQAPAHLNKGGAILLLESSLSKYRKTLRHFRKAGFDAEVVACKKLEWEELVAIKIVNTC